MFDITPNLQFSRYLIHPDECYATANSFEDTIKVLERFSEAPDAGEPLSLSENILVIDTKEGVFIRSQDRLWCEFLTALAENPGNKALSLKIIPQTDWYNVTTRYRAPLQSQGNEKLARWRVGF